MMLCMTLGKEENISTAVVYDHFYIDICMSAASIDSVSTPSLSIHPSITVNTYTFAWIVLSKVLSRHRHKVIEMEDSNGKCKNECWS